MAPLAFAPDARASEPATDIGVLPLQPTPQYQPVQPYQARRLRYRDGDDIPAGYRLEEKPRTGLVIAGVVMVLVPYSIVALSALAADFKNESTWLLLPVLGPWITLGTRDGCKKGEGLTCVADGFVSTGLVIDGILQATGAILFLVGYTNPKTELVRNDVGWRFRPMTIGSGYGAGLISTF